MNKLSESKTHGEFLTRPSQGVSNNGKDNTKSDLILRVGDKLINAHGEEFIVQGMLGQGTYGQVVKCIKNGSKIVAVKIIKNEPAYLNQAQIEVSVLQMLNQSCDPEDEHHIVRLFDTFMFANHLCLVFELLRLNLFEVIQKRGFKGLDLNTVQELLKQMLDCLEILRDAGVIHSDLKPENVLIKGWSPPDIKVIDFGSACYENRTVYQYVQSRFYRSPEVILGSPPYTAAIDMWSLGCVAAELFLGLPLFPGAGGYDMIERISSSIRVPPGSVINQSKFGNEFTDGPDENGEYRILTKEEYAEKNGQKAVVGKNYFSGEKLEDIIFKWGMERQSGPSGREQLDSFLDFLYGILDPNPETRWTPRQASQHPFILGESFLGPYVPMPDPVRPHVRQRNVAGGEFVGSLSNMQWSLAAQQVMAQAQALAIMQLSPGSQQFTPNSLQHLSMLQSQIVGSQSNNFSAGSFPAGSNLLMSNLLSSSTPQNGYIPPALGSAYQFFPLGTSLQQMTQFLQQTQLQQQLQQQQSSCGSSFNHVQSQQDYMYSNSQDTPVHHMPNINEIKKMNSSTRTMASVEEEVETEEIVGQIEAEIGGDLGELERGSSAVYLSPSAEAEWNPLSLDEGDEREERDEREMQLDQECQEVEGVEIERGSASGGTQMGASAQPVPIRGRSKSFHQINDSCQSVQLGFPTEKQKQIQKEETHTQRRIQRNLTFADFGTDHFADGTRPPKNQLQENQFVGFDALDGHK